MILNKNVFLFPQLLVAKQIFLLFSLMKKVNKKIKTPEGIAAVAASLQKTSPIPIVRRGGSGRETPPCFLFAMLPGIEGSVQVFRKLEYNLPIHFNLHSTGKQTNASVEYKPCEQ